jgi:hypothetical protein
LKSDLDGFSNVDTKNKRCPNSWFPTGLDLSPLLPGPLVRMIVSMQVQHASPGIGNMHEISCLRSFKAFLASLGVKRFSKLKLVKAQT